jgi:hypothetical protein
MSATNFNKLQRVQNTLAKTVLRMRKYDHVTPALAELHWLPVAQRVTFKIATLTFKTLHTSQPQYLRDLLNPYVPQKQLRSATQHLLQTNSVRTATGKRAFRNSAAAIWNGLPVTLRDCVSTDCFKRQLKTHLFKIAHHV